MSSPRIALFLPSVHGGGAEGAMLVFGAELIRRGYQVDLVLAKFEGPHANRIPQGVRVVDLQSQRMLQAIPRLVRYLSTTRPCAMFATITHANIAALCASRWARAKCPVVVRQSNAPRSETKSSLGRYIASRIIPFTYPLAHGVIAVSEGVRSELLELNGNLDRLTKMIPTPVLTDDVRRLGDELPPHPWFQSRDVPVVLSAGRLERHKGMLDLVRAFRLVRDKRPASLVIIGQGSDREHLEREVANLDLTGDVDLPGFFANPFCFMNHASVFTLASHYEGLPNVLIQAMAFGTPIVATDCPSGPAEILEGGRLGSLVPRHNREALAIAIEQALDLPKSEIARQVVWQRYGAELATTRYLEIAGLPATIQGANRAG